MDLFLAIDGGGSGSRALLADASGRVLAHATGGPANIATDAAGATATILSLAHQIMGGAARVHAAGLGLAGANAQDAAALLAALPADRVRLETDAVAAALGALGDRDGVVAAIGTGAVYVRREGDRFRQSGGHGLILGDEGAGAWLGRAALSAGLRAHDADHAPTPWLAQLLDRFGGPAGIIRFAQNARPSAFAALAPDLIAAAETDPAAARIMARADAQITTAIAGLRGGSGLPVVFTGGLGPVFHDRLFRSLPLAAPLGTALDGAMMLARAAVPQIQRGEP